MESTIVLESVMNRKETSPLNWRTEIDGEVRIGDLAHVNGRIPLQAFRGHRNALNDKRAYDMIYRTLKNNMRIDEGMCSMIADLTDGDFARINSLLLQAKHAILRERYIEEYGNIVQVKKRSIL